MISGLKILGQKLWFRKASKFCSIFRFFRFYKCCEISKRVLNIEKAAIFPCREMCAIFRLRQGDLIRGLYFVCLSVCPFICMFVCHTFLIFKKEVSRLQILICLIGLGLYCLIHFYKRLPRENPNRNLSSMTKPIFFTYFSKRLPRWLFLYVSL